MITVIAIITILTLFPVYLQLIIENKYVFFMSLLKLHH